jgi:membrane-bound metal-dependent hydrolase YbcI (DUF457 family)
VTAVIALDLVWPILLLAGVEHVEIRPGATAFTPLVFVSYPWSHSLLMAAVWGVILVAVSRVRDVPRSAAWLLAALTVSHWFLDWVTHAPDMPFWPGRSPRVGLGLWNSIPGTLVVEGALWIGAVAMYLRYRPLRGRGPRVAFWSFVVVSTVMWAASPWSSPPPDERSLAWFSLIGWIVVPWVALADRRPASVAAA